jgi:hypothetical protein
MDIERFAGPAGVLALLIAAHPIAAKRTIAIVADDLHAPAAHGISRLRAVLGGQGFDVVNASQVTQADFIILAGHSADGPAAKALKGLGAPLPEGPEALAVRRGARHLGKAAVVLYGSDPHGLMYAALDTAERATWDTSSGNPFEHVRDTTEKPFLAERGVSMYTMHRAYFESRLFDEQHWKRYFDMLAASRINTFVVIFGYENGGFMAPLYPYFFDVDEFPDVRLVGITPDQQSRNAAAFKTMMRLAHERGIGVTTAIWDHIYRGGVQTGGIPGAPKSADERVPGLVWGVTGQNLPAYTKAALRKFLQVFPEVDAIQFRMHEESGLKHDEMVSFWHEVFGLIKQARPDMRLDLRAKGLPDAVIDDALNQGLEARISTKFWMEQMGLPFHPTHVNPQNQKDRRHGYADLLRYPQRYRLHWQLWSGGTTRLLLWGDPDYVRRFAGGARLYGGNSFDVNEMLATKMLGEPHGDKPIEILNPRYRYYDYEFERYWHFYQLWGRLTYDPHAPSDIWRHEFAKRFGPGAGGHVMKAQHLAGKVLPRIVASSYRYAYFPTTRGWAEMKRQDDLPTFAGAEGSDVQQFMNPRDAARSIIQGTDTAMRRPEETSRWFTETSDAILAELGQAEKAIGNRAGNEFQSTATDLKILAALARYYSSRLRAAVSYSLYKESGDLSSFDAAIADEQRAIQAWSDIVATAGDVYSDRLPFGASGHFPRHWKEELQRLKSDFDKLVALRRSATPKPNAKPVRIADRSGEPPVVTLQPVPGATPGHDVVVSAKVRAVSGLRWVRLRYRHLTQFEDYQTAEMALDPATKLYTARIPAAFIDPKWDLMYFVEAVDGQGRGRMYPDLEVETPYVVIPVEREATEKMRRTRKD